jgi:hypothetical protein
MITIAIIHHIMMRSMMLMIAHDQQSILTKLVKPFPHICPLLSQTHLMSKVACQYIMRRNHILNTM